MEVERTWEGKKRERNSKGKWERQGKRKGRKKRKIKKKARRDRETFNHTQRKQPMVTVIERKGPQKECELYYRITDPAVNKVLGFWLTWRMTLVDLCRKRMSWESSTHSSQGPFNHSCLLTPTAALQPGAGSDTKLCTHHACPEALSLAVESFLQEKIIDLWESFI